jgi:hypothetical protein
MKIRVLCLTLLAATGLAACGGDTPPAPVASKPEPVAEAAPSPEPAPAPAAPVATPAAAASSGEQESFATKAATAAIPADAIGGSPVTNMPDAWTRGNEALKKYCADNSIPCDSFFTKESPVETNGYWTMQFFGDPNGQAMYVGVRVFPDGRAEIVR